MRHLLAIATTLVTLSSASAGPMPSDKAEAIKAMGAVINAPETGKLYAPLHATEPYEGVTVERNSGSAQARIMTISCCGRRTMVWSV